MRRRLHKIEIGIWNWPKKKQLKASHPASLQLRIPGQAMTHRLCE
jgi:hypothetical protein